MAKYGITMPIVGYSYVIVEADTEEEAVDKAYDICCDDDNEDVDILELYGVKNVCEGNIVNHPCWNMDIEELED